METLTFGAFEGPSRGSNNGTRFFVRGAMVRVRLDTGDVRSKANWKSSLYRRER
jgi:hypothetical protein